MSPSVTLAFVLLGSLVLMMFAVTNATAYHQWRARRIPDEFDADRESGRNR